MSTPFGVSSRASQTFEPPLVGCDRLRVTLSSSAHGLYRADPGGADGRQEAAEAAHRGSGKDGQAQVGKAGHEAECHLLPGREVHAPEIQERGEQRKRRPEQRAAEAECCRLDHERKEDPQAAKAERAQYADLATALR